jgi:cytoskeletal protein CcmA (bactofilin family)
MPAKKSNRTSSSKSMRRRKSSKPRSSGPQAASLTGTFQGDIRASGHLHIASGAKCSANVKAQSVNVDGSFNGKLVAQNQMKLGRKSQIRGEIVADKLVATDGASFFGTCKLGRMKAA